MSSRSRHSSFAQQKASSSSKQPPRPAWRFNPHETPWMNRNPPLPNHSTSNTKPPGDKVILVVSDSEDEDNVSSRPQPPSVIEIDSDSDDEAPVKGSQTKSKVDPPAKESPDSSRTTFVQAASDASQRGQESFPVRDIFDSEKNRQSDNQRPSSAAQPRFVVQRSTPMSIETRPPEFWTPNVSTPRQRPHSEGFRVPQSAKQTQPERHQTSTVRSSSIHASSAKILNTTTTSSFPTSFKQYTPSNFHNGRKAALPERESSNTPREKPNLLLKLKISNLTHSSTIEPSSRVNADHLPAPVQSPRAPLRGLSPNAIGTTDAKIALRPPPTQAPSQVGAHQNGSEVTTTKDQFNDHLETDSTASGDYQQPDRASMSSEASVNSAELPEVALTLEAITSLIKGTRLELRAWQERNVQAELRQATIDAKTRPVPKIDAKPLDPFRALIEQRQSANKSLEDSAQALKSSPKARTQNKKLVTIRAPQQSYAAKATLLPRYKSIGRVSSSILAPNYLTAKYWAYDAEDETQDPDATQKYDDFHAYYNTQFDCLKEQRQCQELVWLWKPWATDMFNRLHIEQNDVLYFFTYAKFGIDRAITDGKKALESCRKCGLNSSSHQSYLNEADFSQIPPPDDRKLAFVALLALCFHDIAGISLWHVAVGGLLQPQYETVRESLGQPSSLCLICFRHNCPDHGSFDDPDGDRNVSGWSMTTPFVNDSEHDSNVRRFVSLPDSTPRVDGKGHLCGSFCVSPSLNLRQILGRQTNGIVSGDIRTPDQPVRSVLADDQLCGSACFWDVNNRRNINVSEVKFQPFLSASQKALVETLMPFYLHNQRGPCLISRIIKDVDCLMVFNHMVFAIFDHPHAEEALGATSDSSAARTQAQKKNKKKPVQNPDVSRSADLGTRPPFLPCSHDGPCQNNPACTCASNKVHCERFCGCDLSCKRRFRGCTCKAGGKRICFEDSRCECWLFSRECDPHLCGRCGVVDVLDSSNKYQDNIRVGRCKNNRIQLGLPAHTTKSPSQVQGYGLYSRADLKMSEFIGEYTGEIISRSEGNRRGTIYHLINQEYLFNLNLGQEIDASNNGNKMRFMNNSQREEHINVEAKSLLCSGVVRIGLFAKRDIRAGEELLWKYGYSAELVKYFWEPGERPATARALIPHSKERLARSTGRNRLAGESSEESDDDGEPISAGPTRKTKRIRSGIEGSRTSRHGSGEDGSSFSSDQILKITEMDDSQDSDYRETNGHISEDVALDEDMSEDSDLGQVRGLGSRQPGSNRSTPRSHRSDVGNGTPNSSHPSRRGSSEHMRSAGETTMKPPKSGAERKRKIGANDKRFGGRAQQQAWETRKRNGMKTQVQDH